MRSKYYILLFFALIQVPALAQGDRLYNQLEQLKKTIRQSTMFDSAKVFSNGAKAIRIARELHAKGEEGLIYQYYGSFYYYSNDYKNARKYFQKSIATAEQCGDLKLKNSTQIRLAFMQAETDIFKGEDEFNRLLKQAKKHGFIENSIEIYNGLGILYEDRMMADKAIEYYLEGLKIAEKHNKKYFISFLLNNLGLLKYENKQYEEARKDLLRGLRLAIGEKEYRLIGNLHNNLGLVYRELKDYKASIRHFHETVEITEKQGFPFGIGAAFINLGDCYNLDGDYATGMLYTDSAIAIFSQFDDQEYLGIAYLLKSSLYTRQNKLKDAWAYVDKVLELHKQRPSITNYINTFEVRSEIYEKTGNYKKALEFKDRFHELSDSIELIANKDKMNELQVLYGRKRIESQLAQEKTKNKLSDKNRELESAEWRLILIVFSAVSLLVLGFLYIRYVRKSRRQQVLFSQRLIQQIDEERSRISGDLHDNIGQLLSVVKSKINMYNTGLISEITDLDKEVGEVINQTRTISHQLHPSSLEKLGLERSINGLMERTQANTDIICSMHFAIPSDQLNIEVQTQLYRISQECINNTIKHANAASLKITLKEEDGTYIYKYRDNGIGFSGSSFSNGIGMMTIRERVNKINGKLNVISDQQKGMQLVIKFR
ncbi:MAG TPA: sensor histidine kinase [Fluviicola sp.]|nr:sensor histidine kinase [Fluviicola sp.]